MSDKFSVNAGSRALLQAIECLATHEPADRIHIVTIDPPDTFTFSVDGFNWTVIVGNLNIEV